jgi:hypothetical protein
VSFTDPTVQINLYTPATEKPVIVVVGLLGVVMVAVPGLAGVVIAVHVPVPVAAMVAVPPGRIAQETVWSGPAPVQILTVTVSEMPDCTPQPDMT